MSDDVIAIDSFPAGDNLDQLIALRAMGWTKDDVGDNWREAHGRTRYVFRESVVYDAPIFSPSTNIAHAWEVVEKLPIEVEGGVFTVMRIAADTYQAGYMEYEYFVACDATAPTAPLAICRAALKAVR